MKSILQKTIKAKSGMKLLIDSELSFGGQGKVYIAHNVKTNEKVAVKIFNDKCDRKIVLERIKYLISVQEKDSYDKIVFPYDVIKNRDLIGHCTPFIESISLEDYLMNSNGAFVERLDIALSIAKQFKHLHELGISHGDIRAQNFLQKKERGEFKVYCIDLDNFNHTSVPPPNMVGEALYLSPEQREGHNNGKYYPPTIETDLYQLGILFHEILLLLHPAHGHDDTQEDFEKAMSGVWKLDPVVSSIEQSMSISILNNKLCNLIRLALNKSPEKRTTADEWIKAFNDSKDRIYFCPTCKTPSIIDTSKKSCPQKHLFNQLSLLDIRTNKKINIDRNSILIGRGQFNNDLKVSTKQILINRIGPELWVEHLGTNPTQIKQNRTWFDLPKHKKIKLIKNDIIQIMNHKLRVI